MSELNLAYSMDAGAKAKLKEQEIIVDEEQKPLDVASNISLEMNEGNLPSWIVSFGKKDKLHENLQERLAVFQEKLFQYVVNPEKIDIDDLQRTWNAWNLTKEKIVYQDDTEMQNYMQKVHLPRESVKNRYMEYQQQISQMKDEFKSATITEKSNARKRLIYTLKTKPNMDLQYPYLYTTEP